MALFWARGYDATSMSDLTEALGLSASSLYHAFGSKAGLYEACLERYGQQFGGFFQTALGQRPTLQALSELLRAGVEVYTGSCSPCGCAVMRAGRLERPENAEVDALVRTKREASRGVIQARIEQGIAEGDVPPETDAEALSRFVYGTLHGLSAQAADGATADTLHAVVAVTHRALEALLDSR